MPRYFFDTRDDHLFVRDEEGLELSGLAAARAEATSALADMAQDALAKERARTLSVEVRDENDRHVLKASVSADVQVLTS